MLKAKSPFTNTNSYTNNGTNKLINSDTQNLNSETLDKRNSNREYREEENNDEEEPQWGDIDVKDIEKMQIKFQAVPENFEKNENLLIDNKVPEKEDSEDDEEALNKLIQKTFEKTNFNDGGFNQKEIVKNQIINVNKDITKKETIIDSNILFEKKEKNLEILGKDILQVNGQIINTNDIFEVDNNSKTSNNLISEKNFIRSEEITEQTKFSDLKINNLNFKSENIEINNSLFAKNFGEFFNTENNKNSTEVEINYNPFTNITESSDSNQNDGLNTNMLFNNMNQITESSDKQNILLQSLNYGNDNQKENINKIDTKNQIEDIENKSFNNNQVFNSQEQESPKNNLENKNSNDPNLNQNNSDFNKDFQEKFNEQLKFRQINPENFNYQMINNINMQLYNQNKNPNIIPNKNMMLNPMFNNNIPLPNSAIQNLIPGNIIPYPILNRDMFMNNMIQQGIMKPNQNISMRQEETVKNQERERNFSEYQNEKPTQIPNFLENPSTLIQKNLLKKGWTLMDDKNKPYKFLNSVDLLSFLEEEKKNSKINKLNWISDHESDMFFKPSDLLETLSENVPKLLENIQKNHQKNIPIIPDVRMFGIPIVNNPMYNMDKEAFKIPAMNMHVNINPMLVDQRIINMNMMPPFGQMGNLRPNNLGTVNNINNNFNGQSVNMNINLQFVNNDIKFNNIMLGQNPQILNNPAFINNLSNNNLNKENNSNVNNNFNGIPTNFNKAYLQNFPKNQNIHNFPQMQMNPNMNVGINNNFSNIPVNNQQNKGNININNNNNNYNKNKLHDLLNISEDKLNKEDNSFFGSNVFYENNNAINNTKSENLGNNQNLKNEKNNQTVNNKNNNKTKGTTFNQSVNVKNNGLLNNNNIKNGNIHDQKSKK